MNSRVNLQSKLSEKNYANADVNDKVVLLRTCLNVSIDEHGNISDDTRLREALPLILELIPKVKRLVIVGHLGRPTVQSLTLDLDSKVIDQQNSNLSLKKVKYWFDQELKNSKLKLVDLKSNLDSNNSVYLLENIRFWKDEESKIDNVRSDFAKEVIKWSGAEVFINDAFADYRISATTYDISMQLPSFLGPVFFKEVASLAKLASPEKPFVAVLGGAKLSEKLDALSSLLKIADKVIVGGAMAYTLLKAQGINIGKSLIEEDKLVLAKEIVIKYKDKLILPVDHYVVNKFDSSQVGKYTDGVEIDSNLIAIDIGPRSEKLFSSIIAEAKTIMANGPMGVFEWPQSALGTKIVLQKIASNDNAFKLIGGGDSIAAINKFDLDGFSHISTGGGAMLAFMAYDNFPTLDSILNR